jgi:hypothetical protein
MFGMDKTSPDANLAVNRASQANGCKRSVAKECYVSVLLWGLMTRRAVWVRVLADCKPY